MKKNKKNQPHFIFHLIPNMVTLFNLFSGFLSIMMSMEGKLVSAAWLILIALVWDSLDGNIARILKNPTAFGRELDSLADIVSFIVAPCVLAAKFWFFHFAPWTLFIFFFYLGCGAYRLARFNIHPPVKYYFSGLPTPAAAISLAMVILACHKNEWNDSFLSLFMFIAFILVLSFLMISNIPYPKLSAVKFDTWRSLFYTGLAGFLGALFLMNLETAYALLCFLFLFFAPSYTSKAHRLALEAEQEILGKTTKP